MHNRGRFILAVVACLLGLEILVGVFSIHKVDNFPVNATLIAPTVYTFQKYCMKRITYHNSYPLGITQFLSANVVDQDQAALEKQCPLIIYNYLANHGRGNGPW